MSSSGDAEDIAYDFRRAASAHGDCEWAWDLAAIAAELTLEANVVELEGLSA